jgi:adenine-specific DNA methylase
VIEENFDIPFIASLALREKQIQQNYRPVIAVHKWFARRPGTLFRGLLLSEFGSGPVRDSYYKSHNLKGLRIGDPFMGGGTPLLEANRIGCDVLGYDINPMAYWIVREEMEHIDLKAYRKSAEELRTTLEAKLGHLYRTTCLCCRSVNAYVKYFLWVKVQRCRNCQNDVDLFPGYLLAENRRHPKNVFVCASCGELTECSDRHNPGRCNSCQARLLDSGPAKRNQIRCPRCNAMLKYPDASEGPPRHRMFAIEYHCLKCRPKHTGRFFKKPDERDLAAVAEAEDLRSELGPAFIPSDCIPDGDETNRLHRWGYRKYSEMFNDRQLVGLEASATLVSQERSDRIRRALATNFSDLLRYQNMLCRYDTMALKSLDIFSVHGFPVGLVQCESNLLGIPDGQQEANVGSGGWSNIIEKYAKAKEYCDHPFEIRHNGSRKALVRMADERIGETGNGPLSEAVSRTIDLRCGDAASADLPAGGLDAVLTDPPYLGNVQYAELMDFCYVWLRRLAGHALPSFREVSTRNAGELTGNENMNRGLVHFTEGLSAIFRKVALALKPGRPLVFTYHHNSIEAYYPVAVAILDAGLTCSASIPCPAEMGASIHISGTGSSVVDTVFVCRKTGKTKRRLIANDLEQVVALVKEDLAKLAAGGLKCSRGDARCVLFGHLCRLAVWKLRNRWDSKVPTSEKASEVACFIRGFGEFGRLESLVVSGQPGVPELSNHSSTLV